MPKVDSPSRPSPAASNLRSLESLVGEAGMTMIGQHECVGVSLKLSHGKLVSLTVSPLSSEEMDADIGEDKTHVVRPEEAMADVRLGLKHLLKLSGLTQKQLASHLEMDEAQLSRILRRPQKSTYETVMRIERAIDELIEAGSGK